MIYINLITNLYKHQKVAVEKLLKVKVGALYLEMGTGKTRTALELISKRIEKGKVSHVIWLCPCSVKENLRRDIIKHTGSACNDFITICGIETLSSSIKANIYLRELVETKDCYLIVDESNLVKNHKAKRTERIILLSQMCKYKLILNGTPITRDESDLFAQWYVLDWRILGYKSYWSFSNNHLEFDTRNPGRIVRCLNVDYLTEKIAPYSYQVTKSECLDLPEKTYETIYYDITNEQLENYSYVADTLLLKVDEIHPETIYRLFTALSNVISGFKVNPDTSPIEKEIIFKNPLDNPRVETLLDVVYKITDKVIIFAKYTQEIDDICYILNKTYGEGSAVKFDGKMNLKKREKSINDFSDKARFFVANKQCGAYGLNLQFCNYIIYYSNDWDYGTRIQSEDRCHRIGQNKNVHIIDICAADTLDERILSCLSGKKHLVNWFKDELNNAKDRTDLYEWLTKPTDRRKKEMVNKIDLKEAVI